MGVEIERKFLVDHEQWAGIEKPEGTHYRQGYILSTDQHTVRIRVSDKQAFLNLKSSISGISRKEYEYNIPLSDGLEIFDIFTRYGTEKIRYRIPFVGKIWEVDVFAGDNEGLIVAEIELDTEEEPFDLPAWVTREVTSDGKYTNSSLSTNPFKEWKPEGL